VHFKSDVCFIVRNGLTTADVASMLNVDRTRVLNWKRGKPAMIDFSEAHWLEKLRELVRLLRETLTRKGVCQWVHTQHRMLQGRRPIDLFSGQPNKVREAAEAFVGGTYT
jgi:hypothetical protein